MKERLQIAVHAFIEEGYAPYDKPDRSISMLDFFMNCTIAMIRKRDVDVRAYPEGINMLERLAKFPAKYDYGLMQRKAEKIIRYFDRT